MSPTSHRRISLTYPKIRIAIHLVGVFLLSVGAAAAARALQNCSITLDCSLALSYDDGMGGTMPYRLFLPPLLSDDSTGRGPKTTFPLIIFMHGAGKRGTDNIQHVQHHIGGLIDATQTQEYASILLAPQIPLGAAWNSRNSSHDYTLEILSDVISLYPVDINRIFATAVSMGGFGTTRYVVQNPDLFAAAIPMSGAIKISWRQAVSVRNVPFWLFHGDQDHTDPVRESRNFVAALRRVGGNVKYTELAGWGHGHWSVLYDDWRTGGSYGLYPWLFSQSRNSTFPGVGRLVKTFKRRIITQAL